jgi:hypothetical protein
MSKIRLSEINNFGPVTLPEIESLGFKFVDDLQRIGFEEVCRKWVKHFPDRLNANAFLGVIATIEGLTWTKATPSMRAEARNLARTLRIENGIAAARSGKGRKPKP